MSKSAFRFLLPICLVCLIANKKVLGENKKLTWGHFKTPNVFNEKTTSENSVKFSGHMKNVFWSKCKENCGKSQILDNNNNEDNLDFETLDISKRSAFSYNLNFTGNQVQTENEIETRKISKHYRRKVRKRAVFGYDSQYFLSSKKFGLKFPFSTVVKVSTGCTGVQLSSKHILTAAHCIHNGKQYLKGVKKLRVGRFIEKKKRKTLKRKKRKRSKGKQKKLSPKRRKRRQTSAPKSKFKWRRAKKTFVPQAWIRPAKQVNAQDRLKYNYAVIQLKRPLAGDYMKLGIAPNQNNLPRNHRIHFTSFNSKNKDQLVYRSCSVEDQSTDFLFHRCDSENGSSGAGMYMKLYDSVKRQWDRKIVGIFSGPLWIKVDGEEKQTQYNVGVRMTPLKFAQICFWKTGDYSQCRNG